MPPILPCAAQVLLENALFCRQNARIKNLLFCWKFCRQNLSKPNKWVILKEGHEIETNVKTVFEKLNWLKNYWGLIYEIPVILLPFLETKAHFEMLYLLKQLSFSKKKSDLFLSLHRPSKLPICYAISWNLILLSILWRHFLAKSHKNWKTKNVRLFGIQSPTILQTLSSHG